MRSGRAVLALLLAFLAMSACGPRPRASAPEPVASPAGRRLVCLAPNLTETVFALGRGEQVVGVTENDHYPPQVDSLPRVGDIQPDYERILALKPDLVLVDHDLNIPEIPTRLKSLGLSVVAVKTRTLQDLQENLPILGRALEAPEQAEAALVALQAGLGEVGERAGRLPARPRVFVEIWNDPLMTAGSTSLVHELVERAGGRNLYGDLAASYPTISLEDLVRRNPDIVLLTTLVPADLTQRAGWDRLKAVQKGRVYQMDPDLLVRPTLRSVEGLRQMVTLFEAWKP